MRRELSPFHGRDGHATSIGDTTNNAIELREFLPKTKSIS